MIPCRSRIPTLPCRPRIERSADWATLKFTDVDGVENGEYSVEKVEVTLIRKEESQDGWMVGIYAADDVQVNLDPVQPADPE